MNDAADFDAWLSRFSAIVSSDIRQPYVASEHDASIARVWISAGRSPEELWNAIRVNRDLVAKAAAEGRVPTQMELSASQSRSVGPAKNNKLIIGSIALLVTVWFCCGGALGRFSSQSASDSDSPDYRLHAAKTNLRKAIESKTPELLQSALSEAKSVAKGSADKDLKRLIVEAQAVFAPLEAGLKKAKRDSLLREEARIVSSIKTAIREKSKSRLEGLMEESEIFKGTYNMVSPDHAKVRSSARELLPRLELEELKKAMNQYEGAPVAVAVGKIEVRRSFDGYSFDGNGRFVSVYVSVLNTGEASEHINPTNFTLATEDGYTVPYSAHTFSTGRPLNAVNIGRGATTAGWIVFESALSKRYKLIHEPLTGGGRVEKVLVP